MPQFLSQLRGARAVALAVAKRLLSQSRLWWSSFQAARGQTKLCLFQPPTVDIAAFRSCVHMMKLGNARLEMQLFSQRFELGII